MRGGKQEAVAEITPKYMEDLDQRWMKYGVDFINKMAKNDKPFSSIMVRAAVILITILTPIMRDARQRVPRIAIA